MRLNAANRSFFALLATALLPYGLLALLGCGFLSVVGYRLWADGFAGLDQNGQDLRPAVLLFVAIVAGTVVAGRSVHRQVVATHHLAADIARHRCPLSPAVAAVAQTARLAGRVDVIDDDRPYSFAYGVLAPRVVLSHGLVDAVSPDELAAVLHHEHYHVRNWDTLKVVVARAAPSAFFFLPALRHLSDRYLAGRELAADRAAMRATDDRALAGALYKALDGPGWVDLGATAALGGDVLEQRLEQLEDGRPPELPRVPRRALWLTLGGIGALVAAFVLAVGAAGPEILSMDGSMPTGSGGMVLTVLGSAACTASMAAGVVVVIGGTRHRRPG